MLRAAMSADPLLLGSAPKAAPVPAPRSPTVALLLALVCEGLGHFYCGRVRSAIAWALLVPAALPMIFVIGVLYPQTLHLIGFGMVIALVAVRITQAVLAWRIAKGLPAYLPRDINNVGLYFAFFLVCWALSNLVARPARELMLEPFKIPSTSMEPTLKPGDQVFVVKVGPHAEVRRHDVVAYRFGDHTRIGRVVGLPGDTVALRQNVLSVNGAVVPQAPCVPPTSMITEPSGPVGPLNCFTEAGHGILTFPGPSRRDAEPTQVPDGQYFILGDNRDNADDSRFNGPIAIADVVGRATTIWLSLDEHYAVRWNRLGLQL